MNTKYAKKFGLLVGLIGSLTLGGIASAAEKFNTFEDAAVAMAKRWQAGEKAKVFMSSDGKVIFPYGQSMPKLTCSPVRACDIELEPGETPRKVVLGDGENWSWAAADSIERGKPVNHIVIQPKDKDLETNMIVTTDRRTYHVKLYSPKTEGAYLNRMGFYYPEALVSTWAEKAGVEAAAAEKEEALNILPAAVSPDKLAYDYRIDGSDVDFKPIRVVSNGEQVFITMPDEFKNSSYPTMSLVDSNGKMMPVNYRKKTDEKTGSVTLVVDTLFTKAELHRDSEKVIITWKRREKSSWFSRSLN